MILHEQKARIPMSEILVNKEHYLNFGYDVNFLKKQTPIPEGKKPNVDDYKKFRVEVSIEHLHSNYSKAEITVRCDYCLSEGVITDTIMTYEQYRRGESVNLTGKEACKKHKFERIKENSLIKNGVPNASMLPENVQKYKETMVRNHGVDNPQKSKEIQDKTKETLKEKYGVENLSQSEELKEKKRQTSLKNWGVEQPLAAPQVREKIQKTFEEAYGVTHVGSKGSPYREDIDSGISRAYQERGEEIQEKKEQTSIRHFKTSHPMQSEEINEKRRNTTLLKYGVTDIGSSEEIREKRKENNLAKWGVTTHSGRPEYLKIKYNKIVKYISEKGYTLITSFEDYFQNFDSTANNLRCECQKCNVVFQQSFNSSFMTSGGSPYCPNCCKIPEGGSFEEDDLCNFIKSIYSGVIIRNDRKILSQRREIDIFLPELQIGFEYDGCKWHVESLGCGEQYHVSKQLEAKNKGVNLYFLYDFEWRKYKKLFKTLIESVISQKEKKQAHILKKCEDLSFLKALVKEKELFIPDFVWSREEDFYISKNQEQVLSVVSFQKETSDSYILQTFFPIESLDFNQHIEDVLDLFLKENLVSHLYINVNNRFLFFPEFLEKRCTLITSFPPSKFLVKNGYPIKNSQLSSVFLSSGEEEPQPNLDIVWNCGYSRYEVVI